MGFSAFKALLRVAVVMLISGFLALALVRNFVQPPSATVLGRHASVDERANFDNNLWGNSSLLQSYGLLLVRYSKGDWGKSYVDSSDIRGEFWQRLRLSTALILPGALLAHLIALLAAISGVRFAAVAQLSLAAGVLLSAIFTQYALSHPSALNLLPILQFNFSVLSLGWLNYLSAIAAPSVAIILGGFGLLYPHYLALHGLALGSPQRLANQALGMPRWYQWRAAFSLVQAPAAARLLLSVPMLILSGSVVLEAVFNAPGVGQFAHAAAQNADAPALLAVAMIGSGLIAASVSLSDYVLAQLDPRIGAGIDSRMGGAS